MSVPKREETARLLRSICTEVLVVDDQQLTEETRLDGDLDVDSLDMMDVLSVLGGHGIEVDVDELGGVRTIGGLIDLVHARAVRAAQTVPAAR
ncbi:acyl carrier protein [Nocardiopsis aegyptia]|uniref:acyl carrier protein n=1 Tax=Nocardiopsis aegyptia TaxID=220378 RepID=UPI00366B0E08